MSIARTRDDLTPDWLTAALRRAGVLGDAGAVGSVEITPLDDSWLSEKFAIALEFEGDATGAPDAVAVKLASADDRARDMALTVGAHESEVRFYNELAPTVGVRVPRCLFADVELRSGYFTVLVEDRTAYRVRGDSLTGTPDLAALALEELARLQVPRWGDPALREQQWLQPLKTELLFGAFTESARPLLERFGDQMPDDHQALVEDLLPQAAEYVREWEEPFAVTHGDYRLDNMRIGGDGTELTVVDWQGTALAPPLIDAAYLIGASLSVEDRRVHEDELLAGYHAALGVDGYTLEQCRADYRRHCVYGLMFCCGISVRARRSARRDALFSAAVERFVTVVADHHLP